MTRRPPPRDVLAALGVALAGTAGVELAFSGGPVGRATALWWLIFGTACLASGTVLLTAAPPGRPRA